MSLPTKAIDRVFERLSATYGAAWTRQWSGVPIASVKTAWAHELAGFAQNLLCIAWALENLPEKPPNAIEFKQLCRRAPIEEKQSLPAPQPDPQRVQTELAKILPVLQQIRSGSGGHSTDPKAWARRLKAREEAGEKPTMLQCTMWRDALRVTEKPTEDHVRGAMPAASWETI